MKKYYLAYGSNLNIKDMAVRCRTAEPVGIAVLENYRLGFHGTRWNSYLTLEQAKNSSVKVGVWRIDAEDEKQLDRYEGYPSLYFKKDIPSLGVRLLDDNNEIITVDAFVYIMHPGYKEYPPSETYLRTCAEGFYDFNLSLIPLVQAFERASRK